MGQLGVSQATLCNNDKSSYWGRGVALVRYVILRLRTTYHSGFVTTESTTVPGGGLDNCCPACAKKRVLMRFFTTTTARRGLGSTKDSCYNLVTIAYDLLIDMHVHLVEFRVKTGAIQFNFFANFVLLYQFCEFLLHSKF